MIESDTTHQNAALSAGLSACLDGYVRSVCPSAVLSVGLRVRAAPCGQSPRGHTPLWRVALRPSGGRGLELAGAAAALVRTHLQHTHQFTRPSRHRAGVLSAGRWEPRRAQRHSNCGACPLHAVGSPSARLDSPALTRVSVVRAAQRYQLGLHQSGLQLGSLGVLSCLRSSPSAGLREHWPATLWAAVVCVVCTQRSLR